MTCFNFSKNLLLSFILLFLALLVIIKQVRNNFLDGTIFCLICKCTKKSKLYIHLMFPVFFLKAQAGLWNLLPETDTKTDSQHAVNYVLNFAEKWKNTENPEECSNFSLLISFEHNAYLQNNRLSFTILYFLQCLFIVFLISRYLGLVAVHHFKISWLG